MTLRNLQLAAITFSVFASTALAQTSFPEVEPNTNKPEADAAGVITLVSGDSINGTTTGTTATALSTLVTSVDQFRVKTGALPLGIYKHQLAITTTGTAGHTGSIRGLNQTGTAGVGGTAGTLDSVVQTSSTVTVPSRMNVWYGFGKQEEIYYRVTGTTATTSPYVSTLTTTPVTATVIAPAFEAANPITFTTIAQTTVDTELYIFDSTFSPLPAGSNDDTYLSTAAQSTLTRTLAPGTYYVAIGTYNTAWSQPAPADEDFVTGLLMDFPDSLCRSSASTTLTDLDFKITGSNGNFIQSNQLAAGRPFEMDFFQVTVANGAPPIIPPPPANDNCAAATNVSAGGTFLGTTAGASNDGTASCDPGGALSRDAWYTYTQPSASGGTVNIDTCTSAGIDTVLSVYSSCGGAELACNDDCGGAPCAATNSCLSVAMTFGQTILIRVSDKGLLPIQQGDFTLHVTNVPVPPVNDLCSLPTALAGPGLYPFDTTAATTGQGFLTTGCTSVIGGKNVWYTYSATTTGTLTVSTCGTLPLSASRDTKIAIYSGTACPTAGGLGCNDDIGATCTESTLESTVSVPTTCGATYLIEIGNFSTSLTTNIFGNFSVAEVGTSCATPVTYYCAGDGTATACPCGNVGTAGNGCGNSLNPNGANLAASGIASVGGDTWLLSASGIPNGPGLYFQGTTQLNGGLGVVFGDGLRCTGGTVIRLGIVTGVANGSTYPSPNPPAANQIVISLKGFCLAGDIRNYQLWYRDSAAFCNPQVFNLTNAVNVTWTP